MNKHLLLFILTLFSISFLGINSLHAQCFEDVDCKGDDITNDSGSRIFCFGVTATNTITIDGVTYSPVDANGREGETCYLLPGFGNCGGTNRSRVIEAFNNAFTPTCDAANCEVVSDDGCSCVTIPEVTCPDSAPNCLGQVTPGGMSVCGVCPDIMPPPEPTEVLCESEPNCRGEVNSALSECLVCPTLLPPPDPVDFICESDPNCQGLTNTVLSVCGVCPPVTTPPDPDVMICQSTPNCLGEVNTAPSVCGICPVIAPPAEPNEMICESAPNCRGEVNIGLSICGVCPTIDPPADPVDFLCSSEPSCNGDINTAMSICGVCPPIAVPPCPPKCPTTCPPCSIQDPFTCECTPNPTVNECIPYSCDDGNPCTSADVEYRNCDGSICEPCAGRLIEIVSIEVVNMRDCDNKGNHNPNDDTFKGDIVVTFNYSPVIEDFIITGDAYFSYKESYCIVNENTITIENRTFKANGDRITLHGILNDRLGCSYTKNGLGGQALGPCDVELEEEEEEEIVVKDEEEKVEVEVEGCFKTVHNSSTGAYIEGITIDQIFKCYDGGTRHKTSDDYLEAKVTVHFGKALPSEGVLELSGMVSAYVNLYNVSGSSYTFPGRMKLKYKESNSISVVAADYHSSHANICPINTYAYYTDDHVFYCDNPCSSSLNSSGSTAAKVYTNFNAFQQDRHVDLEWLTNQSDKSEAYVIEKSIGGDFEAITEIVNTEFTDEASYFKSFDELPVLGDNHYRLKQIFMDGHVEYSPVRTVNFGVDLDAISFFPNPAESELFIDLDEYAGKTGHMIISNQLGQIVEEINFTEIPSDLIKVDFANYINGLYFIKVKVDRSKYVAKKVLVSKLY